METAAAICNCGMMSALELRVARKRSFERNVSM